MLWKGAGCPTKRMAYAVWGAEGGRPATPLIGTRGRTDAHRWTAGQVLTRRRRAASRTTRSGAGCGAAWAASGAPSPGRASCSRSTRTSAGATWCLRNTR